VAPKRIFIAGLLFLLWIPAVNAACPTSAVQNILNFENDPVSDHYIKEIADRKNDGIARAQSAPGGSGLDRLFFHYMDILTSSVLKRIDTKLRIIEHSRNLRHVTACLNIDMLILEAMMEEVRCEMHDAHDRQSLVALIRLTSLMEFLDKRYLHLTQGALDVDYEDKDWRRWQLFDVPFEVWCAEEGIPNLSECTIMDVTSCVGWPRYATCEECAAHGFIKPSGGCREPGPEGAGGSRAGKEDEEMCPFTSDYFPPNIAGYKDSDLEEVVGYGCDDDVLSSFSGHPTTNKELDAYEEIIDARDDYFTEVDAYLPDLGRRLETVRGGENMALLEQFLNSFRASEDRDHWVRYGCEAKEGDPAGREAEFTGRFPPGGVATELYGPFEIDEDHTEQLRLLYKIWRERGSKHELPDYLRHPHEFPPGSPGRAFMEDKNSVMDWIIFVAKDAFRSIFINWTTEQGGKTAYSIPKVADPSQRILRAVIPMRPVVRDLIVNASELEDGGRSFVRNFAYYIRRSCIFRPCNRKLQLVLRLIFEDECFPYASGEFLGDQASAPNERAKKCREAADLNEEM